MPRKQRLFVSGATYHVYCRVARGEFVFDDDFEAIEFVDVLQRVRDLDGWTILAWCLMANHYHLVIKTSDVDLWRSMARLQGSVARGFNRRHRYLGRLWQSRYKARVIDSEAYFQQVVSYVHLNPVAAGLVEDPADYIYCGHREILGLCRPFVIDRAAVLSGFGIKNGPKAAAEYLERVRLTAEIRWAEAGIEGLPWWADGDHIDDIADASHHSGALTHDHRIPGEQPERMTLKEFVHRFQKATGQKFVDLVSIHRSPTLLNRRIEFATLAISRFRIRSREVARLLEKDGSTITRWLNRGLAMERSKPTFRDRLLDLERLISSP